MIDARITARKTGNRVLPLELEWEDTPEDGRGLDPAGTEAGEGSSPGSGRDCARVWVVPGDERQMFYGFGGAFTEASAWLYSQLPREEKTRFIRSYFAGTGAGDVPGAGAPAGTHPGEGVTGTGYVLGRVHMNSCDFALGNYNCTPGQADRSLGTFTIERDRQWVIPMIKDALAVQPDLEIMVSPWSPPWWMKDNGQMNYGGSLLPQYYGVWAEHFVRFIQAYRQEGIPIRYVSVQNEPEAKQIWDSCLYTPEEETAFIRDHLGPALKRAGLEDVRILLWDHNRDRLDARCRVSLEDSSASAYIWGIGYHWYSGFDSELLGPIRERYPRKPLILTESTIEGGAKPGRWDRGEIYGKHILSDIAQGCGGWIDWNLLLDYRGGPNHVGNFCDAPVLCEPDKGRLTFQTSHTYLGHLSRVFTPGSVILGTRSYQAQGLYMAASRDRDGRFGLAVLNPGETARELGVFQQGRTGKGVGLTVPEHSVVSLTWPAS
ncbi:glycoside hydrolase family 30 protein [Spirochaeta lutea]|uniref:glycoside hydrolase family 30 protein n=1 Tax=Spirochaeta lutea TaxID=1480694 RepID=UPI00068C98D0|nr:hypothetical protein [Spirochaeta lutea]